MTPNSPKESSLFGRAGAPLRRTKTDLIATATIGAVAALCIGTVWVTSPISHSELSPAAQQFVSPPALASAPAAVAEKWKASSPAVPKLHRPLVVDGVVVQANSGTVSALDPATGEQIWSYERDLEVCSLGVSFGSVVATYRNSAGCGDVTQIDAKTGKYRATRSAPSVDNVVPVSSNDRVGTVSPERVELWRSDLVRTVEYGDKEAKQEPNMQPHEECTISSALTRKDLLAIAETCPDQPNNTMLRLQSTTPEDSRKPKAKADVAVAHPDAQVVSVGQTIAAVYVPSTPPRLISYEDKGTEKARLDVKESPLVTKHLEARDGTAFSPDIADLPHHMTWFDGTRLYLLNPATLAAEIIFEGALGTGTAIGDRIIFPVANGLAVGNWSNGTIERTIPVNRGDYQGPVTVALAGNTIVEKRGDSLVGLVAAP